MQTPTPKEFVAAVEQMRDAQRRYFRTRDLADLKNSKTQERRVDEMIELLSARRPCRCSLRRTNMPKYTCDFNVTLHGTATVEAATPEDALDAISEAVSDEYMRSSSFFLGDETEFAFADGEEGTLRLEREPGEYHVYPAEEVPHE